MNDILPPESWKWALVESKLRDHFRLWGYEEIRTPVVEPLELFKRGVGEGTDIVSKEMYNFKDRNEQDLVLRPEGTAAVVRSLIEHQWMSQREGERLFYLGPFFRYERPQKGRLRQFHQYGAEVIGSASPLADAEMIAMYDSLLKNTFLLSTFKIQLNSLGNRQSQQTYRTELARYVRAHLKNYCEKCHQRLETNPLRILDCKVESCVNQNKHAPKMTDSLDEESKKFIKDVQVYLDQLGVDFEMNHAIVRGLDYYQHTTFEFVSSALGAQSALGGGGRYDRLFTELGASKPQASVGFAGGIERLMIALEDAAYFQKQEAKKTLFICYLGSDALKATLKISKELRKKGVDVHYVLDEKSLKAQMKASDRQGCLWTLIIGDQEVQSNTASLKNMQSGNSQQVPLNKTDWVEIIK